MQSFEYLMTRRPHMVQQIVISDLHLSSEEPALVQAFLALLNDCVALPALKRLFILGDWFDVWLGDDAYLSLSDDARQTHWLTPMIAKLKQLRTKGCHILVMHGNRDFLFDQRFCDLFGGQLIYEPYFIKVADQSFRLEHGDALCTDDKKYQLFRKLIRHRVTKWYLLNKSLEKRLIIADNIRTKSTQNNSKKADYIMDVNEGAVNRAIYYSDALLHGHTHRPESLYSTGGKSRHILGDWRLIDLDTRKPKVTAVIGAITAKGALDEYMNNGSAKFDLVEFKFLIR